MAPQFTHLLHEEDEDLPEELDEVDEEVEGVPDGVLVAPAALLDDGLRVVDHEAAEDQQAAPQVQLEQGRAPGGEQQKKLAILLLKQFFFAEQCGRRPGLG